MGDMEALFRTHAYLVEHTNAPVRRALMDEIRWSDRLIGIKGSRGVGKTTFLLQYAKENFQVGDRKCLYINMNNFYFQGCSIADFARKFRRQGGEVLLIDQVFKQPDWSRELRQCYDTIPGLKIVFTGSSVMRLKEENPELNGIVSSYNLRGFSFREYLNLQTDNQFPIFSLEDILTNHDRIVRTILPKVSPLKHFQNYLHHGFYPFFLEKRNFSENLLKTMNMMLEVDVLLIKQIDLTYLAKIKKLLYLLARESPIGTPNVSHLANEIQTSRATVMNYLKYLADARLISLIYPEGEAFPKKPAKVVMYNTNLTYAMRPTHLDEVDLLETFFRNQLGKDYRVNKGNKYASFSIEGGRMFNVCATEPRKMHDGVIYARHGIEVGRERQIPLWLFGFLY